MLNNKRSNLLPGMTNNYISNCINNKTEPYCPVFLIKNILDDVEPSLYEQEKMLTLV